MQIYCSPGEALAIVKYETVSNVKVMDAEQRPESGTLSMSWQLTNYYDNNKMPVHQ